MPGWTFITRYAVALSLVAKHQKITAIELANKMGITERAVRKIIADLSAAGYIRKKREGRGLRYIIDPALSLRHVVHRDVAVGDLLASLGWKRDEGDNQP